MQQQEQDRNEMTQQQAKSLSSGISTASKITIHRHRRDGGSDNSNNNNNNRNINKRSNCNNGASYTWIPVVGNMLQSLVNAMTSTNLKRKRSTNSSNTLNTSDTPNTLLDQACCGPPPKKKRRKTTNTVHKDEEYHKTQSIPPQLQATHGRVTESPTRSYIPANTHANARVYTRVPHTQASTEQDTIQHTQRVINNNWQSSVAHSPQHSHTHESPPLGYNTQTPYTTTTTTTTTSMTRDDKSDDYGNGGYNGYNGYNTYNTYNTATAHTHDTHDAQDTQNEEYEPYASYFAPNAPQIPQTSNQLNWNNEAYNINNINDVMTCVHKVCKDINAFEACLVNNCDLNTVAAFQNHLQRVVEATNRVTSKVTRTHNDIHNTHHPDKRRIRGPRVSIKKCKNFRNGTCVGYNNTINMSDNALENEIKKVINGKHGTYSIHSTHNNNINNNHGTHGAAPDSIEINNCHNFIFINVNNIGGST